MIQNLFNIITQSTGLKTEYVLLLFFSLVDLTVGKLITDFFDKKEKDTNKFNYVELIYLFNHVTIINCIKFNLDSLYLLFSLLFARNINNFIGTLFFCVGVFTNPGLIFLNFFYLIYNLIYEKNEQDNNNSKLLWRYIFTILFFVLLFSAQQLSDHNFIFNYYKLLNETKVIYTNYYMVKDTLPNIGFMWYLLPEVRINFIYTLDFSKISNCDLSNVNNQSNIIKYINFKSNERIKI